MACYNLEGAAGIDDLAIPNRSIRFTDYLVKICARLDLDFETQYPYIVFKNDEDYATIQFYL